MRLFCVALLAVAAPLLLAACGDDESTSSQTSGSTISARSGENGLSPALETELEKKSRPELEVPEGPRPRKLIIRDLQVGHGPKAKKGDEVTIHYRGINWLNRSYADSWQYPDGPPTIELGNSPSTTWGLDLGIRGMRVGGRRELIIPASFINPPTDTDRPRLDPKINTLIFKVDLLAIN